LLAPPPPKKKTTTPHFIEMILGFLFLGLRSNPKNKKPKILS
jgi:hypothetical protein